MNRVLLSLLTICAVANTTSILGADSESRDTFAENYTKHEYRIAMRDGVKLFTVVYSPKHSSKVFPIILYRTPYDLKPYTIDFRGKPGEITDELAREKYIFALQDVRGRFMSGGEFIDERPHNSAKGPRDIDESSDTYDTIDWLVKHVPNNNGNVGLTGISYLGFYAAAGMIDSHPALKAVSPQAPSVDLFDGDDVLHGGGFWLVHNFGFFHSFGQQLDDPTREEPRRMDFKTPDGYRFFLNAGSIGDLSSKYMQKNKFWNEIVDNINDRKWCDAQDLTRHLKNVKTAVMTVGGWFDAEDLHGALKTYQATETNNPGIYNSIVMGPWSHGQWHRGEGDSLGPIQFHGNTASYYREHIEVPFFNRFLKESNDADLPKAFIFETGTDEWREFSSWPPTNVAIKNLWLSPQGRLGFDQPEDSVAYDEFVSDPNHPVPFTARISTGMPRDYMIEDQRFAATRPDVLVFQTEPLSEDVTLVGPVTASLHVSTTGTDADWVVKLIDVYTGDHRDPDPDPAGVRLGHYQQLVRGEPLRGKFRNGYANPQPFKPSEVTLVEWTMPDVCHTFRTGHRIMVQVQSSWFPLLDRNPQSFCDIYHARPADFKAATHRVYHSRAASSSIRVSVLPNPAMSN